MKLKKMVILLFLVLEKKNANNQENMNKVHKFIGTIVELENYVYNSRINKKVKLKNVISKYNPELEKIKSSNIKIKYRN